MKHPSWRNAPTALLVMVCVLARPCASAEAVPAPRLDGFNVIEAAGHPFGSASAKVALANAKHLGASAIAIIPFLWQSNPASPRVRRGDDMTDIELRVAIRDAHALGLAAIVKPHVWIPESWAGAIAMDSESAWQDWFANYRRALDPIARIAEEEKAEAVVIGTELAQTTQQPQWNALIGRNAPYLFRPFALRGAQHRGSRSRAVLGRAGRRRGDIISAARRRRRSRRSTQRNAGGRSSPGRCCGENRKNHPGRRDRAALSRGRRGETVGERRGTGVRCRSGASGASTCGLACHPRSAVDPGRRDLALVHRSGCRRFVRHRFHRSGQTGGTCSKMRVDAKMCSDRKLFPVVAVSIRTCGRRRTPRRFPATHCGRHRRCTRPLAPTRSPSTHRPR